MRWIVGIEASPACRRLDGAIGWYEHEDWIANRVTVADPEHRDDGSFASFSDPDGNGWLLQEVKTRAPGR